MIVFKQRALPYAIEGYPGWLSALLHARGVHTPQQAEQFLSPSLSQLHDPMLLAGMKEAVSIVRDAARLKRRVVIYGDYDVDGMCASAILYETLRAMGMRVVNYIPDRHTEGYGLNLDAIRSLAAEADVLISVDCGITSVEEVEAAKALQMTVIITDHHSLPDTLPEADAVISPLLPGYPYPYLCGAGVAWKLSCALKGLDFAKRQLDLAALATMADMVPLNGENRAIAWLGIGAMASTGRAGLKALKEAAGIPEGKAMTSDQMVFQLAPRLNAGGRLSTAMDALELLKAERKEQAEPLAEQLDALNSLRRQEERAVLEEAERQITGETLHSRRTLVVSGENWNSGVIGLAAGRLAEKYHYPTVALTANGETLVGSARSAGSVNLYEALKACQDLFVRFGGHPKAAGLTIEKDRLAAFAERFDQAVRAQLPTDDLVPECDYDTVLPLEELTPEMVKRLEALAPFGVGNPSPVFLAENVTVLRQDAVGADRRHLKLTLEDATGVRDGIAFSMGHLAGTFRGETDVLFQPQMNEFRGKVSAECLVRRIKPGLRCFRHDPDAEKRLILQELALALSNGMETDVQAGDGAEAPAGTRGTLFLCRTFETADSIRQRFPWMDALEGKAEDARAFHAVALGMPAGAIAAPYETVVFADGLIHATEAGLVRAVLPKARLVAPPRSQALERCLNEIAPDIEEMREAYKALRAGRPIGLHPVKGEAALRILEEMGLIKLTAQGPELLPPHPCDPSDSALYRALSQR